MITLGHMTNKKHLNFLEACAVVTKIGRMVAQTYGATNLRVTCSYVQVVT